MILLKCKICGGDIQATDNTFGTCDSCGNTMTLPKASDERKANLFNRANNYRRQNEFDKALQAYENILNDDTTDAEAYWGIVLSRFGIEYVEDPKTHERIPTCRRAQFDPILSDPDYLEALKHASDEYTKSLYEKEAQRISKIQKDILAISKTEKPYDVFICYKESTDGGSRTIDSTIAQDIYYQLEKDGYRVFFAKITLEAIIGQQWEPYIFSALNSAKVMLVIGTRKEYFESVWVKNEWSRFLAIMRKDSSRLLIPCFRDMNAYDIPDELSYFQSQDMSKIGFLQDILHGVKKVLDAEKTTEKKTGIQIAGTTTNTPGVDSLVKRGFQFLEDEDWKKANEYFDKVLDMNPECAQAHVGKLCVDLKLQQENLLAQNKTPIYTNRHFQKALRFADSDYCAKLNRYSADNKQLVAEIERQEQERKRHELYIGLVQAKIKSTSEKEYQDLAQKFREMNDYKDSEALAKECFNKYRVLKEYREEQLYIGLVQEKNNASTEEKYQDLAKKFRAMNDYKDSATLAIECDDRWNQLKEIRLEQHYFGLLNAKTKASTEEEFKDLAKKFLAMYDYKDTTELAIGCDNQCNTLKKRREELERIEKERREQQERLFEERRLIALKRKKENEKKALYFQIGIALFFLFIIWMGRKYWIHVMDIDTYRYSRHDDFKFKHIFNFTMLMPLGIVSLIIGFISLLFRRHTHEANIGIIIIVVLSILYSVTFSILGNYSISSIIVGTIIAIAASGYALYGILEEDSRHIAFSFCASFIVAGIITWFVERTFTVYLSQLFCIIFVIPGALLLYRVEGGDE